MPMASKTGERKYHRRGNNAATHKSILMSQYRLDQIRRDGSDQGIAQEEGCEVHHETVYFSPAS